MSTNQRPPIVYVDPELDRLVNDENLSQLEACRRLYGGPTDPETTMIATPPAARRPEPTPVPVAPIAVRGRRPVADVLRWLTGGAR